MFSFSDWPLVYQSLAREHKWSEIQTALSETDQNTSDPPIEAYVCYFLKDFKKSALLIGASEKIKPLMGEEILLKAKVAEALNAITTSLECYEAYFEEVTTNVEALKSYAQLCLNSNELDKMAQAGDLAIGLAPDDAQLYAALLFNRQYLDLSPKEESLSINKFERYLDKIEPLNPAASLSSEGKIRIGYLSSDLRFHSTYYFIQGVLASHDKELFEIYCFYTCAHSDVKSRELMELADKWHDISKNNDLEAAQLIRSESIDVMIDLTGHMNGSRSGIFAYRPAVFQGIWIGWLCAMGFPQCNFRISDQYADPCPEMDELYAGEVVRLEHGIFTFMLPEGIGPVSELPALRNNYVTFGSFNNSYKQNDQVLRLWARILKSIPNSKLILKHRNYENSRALQKTADVFLDEGISIDRVHFVKGQLNNSEHLTTYHHIDICLDPFPYNGVTSTCEALVMGIPVICLIGRHHRARIGSSLLHHLNKTEWLAADEDDYLSIAIKLAGNLEELKTTRQNLREEFLQTPLGNPRFVTKSLEENIISMVQKHQSKNKSIPVI